MTNKDHLPLGFEVKQLEWVDANGVSEAAEFGRLMRYFAVQVHNGKGEPSWTLEFNGEFFHQSKTLEEAKASAQADFERRVRECLVAKPVEVLDDASIQAKVSEIGNQIHNLGCEYQNNEDLSDRLKEIRDQLWDISKNCTKLVDVAAVRKQAFEEAAKIADNGMLVPPDGGSPACEEIEVALRIAAAIRALSPAEPVQEALK